MPRTVTHIIETITPEPGGLACTLAGLFEFQKRKGWCVEVVSRENMDRAETAVGAADLTHVHGTDGAVIRQLWPTLKLTHKRYIVSTYASKMPKPQQSSIVQWIKERRASLGYGGKVLRKAWCLHALTESEADQLKRGRGIHRVKVLPMGIDVCTAEQEQDTGAAAVCPGKRMVLYLGPLHPGEGLVPLLKAAAMVADRFEDLRLVLAGAEQPRWTEMIRAAVRRQGFEDRVTLLPSPDPEQMQQLLREMILLVAPVPGQWCPVAPLQALACGKPVIISPGCNLPEVAPGKAGWIVKPRRRELQSVLHEAFSRAPGDLEEMGRRGARIIEERYAWDRIGHEYLNLYARILG